MARKKIGKKAEEHVELDPSKDEFIETSMSVIDWLVERRKVVGLILGVGFLTWIIILAVGYFQENKNVESSKILAQGLDSMFAPIVENGETPPGLKEDAIKFGSIESRKKETIKLFDQGIEKMSSESAKAVGIYLKAATLAAAGDYEAAVPLYKQALNVKDLSFMSDTIAMELGMAFESTGKMSDAKSQYDSVAKSALKNSRMALFARFSSARVSLLANAADKNAEKELQSVVDDIVAKADPDRNDYLLVQARAKLLSINKDAKVPELPSGLDPQMLRQLLQAQQGAGGSLQ
ncbi:MAG: hypothetical protein JXR91_08825 [Deltaproteobacteria bacterium]|nr:hypothetical protein [Deltaproteobacteria bacterium]